MNLGITAPDVLNYMGQVFTSIWPILAIGLGIAAVPMLIGAAKTVFGRR
jgi:hypothetical protein